MTRLMENDIKGISKRLYDYDMVLKKTMGYTLEEIAKKAAGICCGCEIYEKYKIAVIPVTGGMGIINGFAQTISDILRYCKADVFVSGKTDVAGIQEAYRQKADIVFMADDDVCGAFSLNGKVYSDNSFATGIAFAAALELMMERVENEEVLILGAGPVGNAAARYFSGAGAVPVLCDIQEERAYHAAKTIKNARVEKSRDNMRQYVYMLDATPSADFIKEKDVTERTKISAPGMPLGAAEEIRDKVFIFHNPLELGIMTMYFDCVNQLKEVRKNG